MFANKTGSALRLYGRALREARAFWPHLFVVLLLGLAATPIALLTPLPLKLVVDSVLGTHGLPWFLEAVLPSWIGRDGESVFHLAVALTVLLMVVQLTHRTADWLFREWVAERMVRLFRGKLFRRSLEVAAAGQDAATTQDLAYRIMSDAPALQWTAIYGFIPVIVSLASLAGTIWVTAGINPTLALIALGTAGPAIWLINFSQRRMRGRWHDVKEEESAAQAVVQETLGALRLVTTFGQEQREQDRFLSLAWRAIRARLAVLWREGLLGAVLTLSTAVGGAAVLYFGVRDVQAQLMTVGDLLLIIAYLAQLYEPLQAIGSHIAGQQRALVSAERAFALLDQAPTVVDDGPVPLRRASGDIVFDSVAFAYAGCPTLLSGVSLQIPAGARVGIIGKTGSGKSTLLNLLLRLHDPAAGAIRLDGVDLRKYRLADLRGQFAVVSQEPVLFSTTIAENIAYGRPGAAEHEIIAAARAAQAHDFIMSLPEGYHTRVGDRGTRLSGGERQRIALARAFLKDSPILVLDEPTSALDGRTETAVIEALRSLMQGRTVLMITHRLDTLRDCDMVLRVEDGAVFDDRQHSYLHRAA
ncbi:MAG TPA: ABC transporter ATP-binding protein [Alphaproteobacteria bacterium]|nr:ABC transporter ATP-binding protein [Alphaproteobacteria bacterium]